MDERKFVAAGTPILGVDVGNGYAKVSLLTTENADPVSLLPQSLLSGMPSTAYVAPTGEIGVYGVRNKRPTRAVEAVKTQLTDSFILLEEKGQSYQVSPCDVYAAIARDLVALANEERRRKGDTPIYQMVLTYPATFKDRPDLLGKLKSSVESVSLDGHQLEVCGMLSEPAAVAVDYLYYMRNLSANPIDAEKYTVLVYDLGHGTFDTAVVTAYAQADKDCELHCQDGDGEIGGKTFDRLLYTELVSQVRDQAGENAPFDRENLRRLAVEMKHELSRMEISEKDFFAGDEEVLLRITRDEFVALIQPQLMKTMEIVDAMRSEAGMKGIKIDAVVLSGGCSNIPVIRETLLQVVENQLPVAVYRPSFGVTYGAARAAHGLYESSTISKVIAQHCERSSGIYFDGEVHFLLNEDAELPCVSEPLELISAASGHNLIKLRRARDRMPGAKKAAYDDCADILRIPVDLPPSTECTFRLKMDTNRCIFVECTPSGGETITISTFQNK